MDLSGAPTKVKRERARQQIFDELAGAQLQLGMNGTVPSAVRLMDEHEMLVRMQMARRGVRPGPESTGRSRPSSPSSARASPAASSPCATSAGRT